MVNVNRNLTRREALRWAASATLVGALTPALLAACGSGSDSLKEQDELDVAIIGGGPTGLYSAYRLLTGTARSGSPVGKSGLRVGVFEASGRLGGRIWSVATPGAPHLMSEYGGMRFLRTQEIVPRLIDVLGLPNVPASESNGRNFVHLRGERFRENQYGDPQVVPYDLPRAEQGLTPADLLLRGITRYVPDAATLTPTQWTKAKASASFDGELLRNQGYWNLMAKALSSEGYALMRDGVGYPVSAENWNAVETMQQMSVDFGPGATFRAIVGGLMRLPLTLAAIARQAGAAIHLNSTAITIEAAPGGGSTITIADASGATTTVRARRVILAIPSDPMRQLASASPLLQDTPFTLAVDAIGTRPSTKLMLAFEKPWWTSLGIVGGSSITDLPANRIWYFGSEEDAPGGEAGNQRSLLMCYTDSSNAEYWDGYQSEANANGSPAPRTAPPRMIQSVRDQLAEVHGVDVPEPYWTGFIDWSTLPYGNAFHAWKVHADSGQIIPYLRNPFDGTGISVAVDCWSPSQDFIESGLTVAEGLLQSEYQLEPPPWLEPGMGIST